MSKPLRIGIAVLVMGCFMQSQAMASDTANTVSLQQSKGKAALVFADFTDIKIDLKPFSNATTIDNAKIISSIASPTDARLHYIVLRLSGPTTSGHGGGQCGAGYETNLVWLKLYSPVVIGSQSVLTDSCAFTLESANATNTKKGDVIITFGSFSEVRDYMLSYSEEKPENGFLLTSKVMQREQFK